MEVPDIWLATVMHRQIKASHTELLIGNRQRNLLLVLDLVEKTSQTGGDLSFNESSNFLQSGSSTVELLETLQFQPT